MNTNTNTSPTIKRVTSTILTAKPIKVSSIPGLSHITAMVYSSTLSDRAIRYAY